MSQERLEELKALYRKYNIITGLGHLSSYRLQKYIEEHIAIDRKWGIDYHLFSTSLTCAFAVYTWMRYDYEILIREYEWSERGDVMMIFKRK